MAKLKLSGSGTANGQVVIGPVPMDRFHSVSIQTTATAFVGTLALQGSNDGTNWVALKFARASDPNTVNGGLTAASLDLHGDVGFAVFRAVMSAYTSGTCEAVAYFTDRSIAPTSRSTFPAT